MQPIPPIEMNSTSSASSASQFFRRLGTLKNSSSASAVPPVAGHRSRFIRFSALVVPVVFTVMVTVCVCGPEMVTESGERLHVAGSLASAGATVHVK